MLHSKVARVFASTGILLSASATYASAASAALLPGSSLGFERRPGRQRSAAEFVASGPMYSILVSSSGVTFDWPASSLRMEIAGSNPHSAAFPEGPLPEGRSLYLGNDPALWRSNVEVYSTVRYKDVYSGIDILYHGTHGDRLEYDFSVSPGADPAQIRVRFTGAQSIGLSPAGDLVIRVGRNALDLPRPHTYQETQGTRRSIDVKYRLLGDGEVGFAIGRFDPSTALVIDPVLSFSTFLGGDAFDAAYAVALDPAGNIYVTGETFSTSFVTGAGSQSSTRPNKVVFVVKMNPAGTSVLYSTFLGGTQSDSGRAIAVDSAGDAYVTGVTSSKDFPMTSGVFDGRFKGFQNAFVVKLGPAGFLQYSSYLGGSGSDFGTAVAIDGGGNAYVAGYTSSSNFPTTPGAYMTAYQGGFNDAFVTKINPQATAIVYSTFLGGSGNDTAAAMALDASGDVYVTGQTSSSNFPLVSPLQAILNGSSDAFVTKMNASGSALPYSTYLGGSSSDGAAAIALDSSSNAYITGWTQSWDFPVTALVFQPAIKGGTDAFVAKLNSTGTQLTYATYLGGTGIQQGTSMSVDANGQAWLTGFTAALDFPLQNALQTSNRGLNDAFLTIVDPVGATLLFSTFLGGSGDDRSYGLAIDGLGHAVLAGFTTSSDFLTSNAFQSTYAGNYDAFVGKIQVPVSSVGVSLSVTAVTLSGGATQQFTAIVTGASKTAVTWSITPATGAGTISASGLYTAPATITSRQIVTITATSVADPTKSASATITLTPPLQSSQDLALSRTATQSSTYAPGFTDASKAVDGNTDGVYAHGSLTHTDLDANAWWQVDLGASVTVNSIVVWNRTDCCGNRLSDYWVFVSNTPFASTDTPATLQSRAGTWSSHQTMLPNPSATISVPGAQGRYARVQLNGANYLSLAEVQVFGVPDQVSQDLALSKTATQSSSYAPGFTDASRAVDGDTDGVYADGSLTHTNFDASAWWQVDLGAFATVSSIVLWNRTDCCASRLSDYWVFVSNTPFASTDTPVTLQNRAGTWSSHQTVEPNPSAIITVPQAPGRYVRVQLSGANYLSLAEVQVFGQ